MCICKCIQAAAQQLHSHHRGAAQSMHSRCTVVLQHSSSIPWGTGQMGYALVQSPRLVFIQQQQLHSLSRVAATKLSPVPLPRSRCCIAPTAQLPNSRHTATAHLMHSQCTVATNLTHCHLTATSQPATQPSNRCHMTR